MNITWDDIAESVRLDEVLTDLGIDIQEVNRTEHWASCPLPTHPSADVKPSFSVNEVSMLYNCFVCGGGPLPLLVAEMQGLESDEYGTRFDKALEWLLPYSDGDIEVDDDEGFMDQLERYLERESRVKRSRETDLPYYSPRVIERLDYAPLDALDKWGIKHEATVVQFGIRYDEARRRTKGKRDYEGPALVIPHIFRGEIVGYQERWLDDDRPHWIPKYTNSDNFPKATTLYNWDGVLEEARRGQPPVVVESTLTTARLWEVGYSSTATFGASVRDEQIRLLRTLRCGVILGFDDDPDFQNARGQTVEGAGKKAMNDVAQKLLDYIPVWSASPGAGDKGDFADLSDEEIVAAISRMLWVD